MSLVGKDELYSVCYILSLQSNSERFWRKFICFGTQHLCCRHCSNNYIWLFVSWIKVKLPPLWNYMFHCHGYPLKIWILEYYLPCYLHIIDKWYALFCQVVSFFAAKSIWKKNLPNFGDISEDIWECFPVKAAIIDCLNKHPSWWYL